MIAKYYAKFVLVPAHQPSSLLSCTAGMMLIGNGLRAADRMVIGGGTTAPHDAERR
jgi:hypothetical protein